MQFSLPQEPKNIILTLENAGFEAWCVGGCVRDMLLNKTPLDYDIATSCPAENVKKLFSKTIDTGLKHGTVTILINNTPYEVTTYRTDGDYKNHRSPEKVEFVSDIKEDLSRRDFTVNALAYHFERGILDIFGGIEDLNNKTLRAVGNADLRFTEDALRILRLFRFSSVLGFDIEEYTLKSALEKSYLLEEISRERIATEFFKILCSDFPTNAAPLFQDSAFSFIGIEKADFIGIDKFEKRKELRLAYFCKHNNINAVALCELLKTDNDLKKYCKNIFSVLNEETQSTTQIKKCMRDFGETETKDALILLNQDSRIVDEVLNKKEPYLISHLAIDGNDLIHLGFSGNTIGEILRQLSDIVIENPKLNTKEHLINLIKP